MREPIHAQYPLGLQLEHHTLRGALLSQVGEQPRILRVFSLAVKEDSVGPRHISVLNTLRPAIARDKLRRALFATGLPTPRILIRPLDIKLTKDKDIDSVLAYQAEPLLPFPVDEAVVDRTTLSRDEEGSQLAVFAARKGDLEEHLESFQSLNIEPEAVSCYPAALAAYSAVYAPQEEPIFVIDLGLETITTLLVDDGKVLAAHSMSSVLRELQLAIKDASSADFNELTKETGSAAASSIQKLQQELSRAIFALGKQAHGQAVQLALIVGEGACLGNLASYLANITQKTLLEPKTKTGDTISTTELKRYAIPIGLGLGFLPGAQHQLNFRQAELSYPYPWKRLKQPIALYVLLCLLISLFITTIGNQKQDTKVQELRQQYSDLLQVLQVEHETFEQTAMETPPGEEIAIDQLSIPQISQRIKWIEEDIAKAQYIFPLKPNVPRVSDLLAWITSNPKVVRTHPDTGEKQALLKLESLNYSMVKRPDKSKQRERYQVKVELEFTSPEAKWAREFYDALIAPNDFVDPRGEVKWSAAKGSYKTSFFLKDRTYYP